MSWRVLFIVGFMFPLLSGASQAEGRAEELWRSIYAAELRCDSSALRNAMVRLVAFDRFGFLELSVEQRNKINERIAKLAVATRDDGSSKKIPGAKLGGSPKILRQTADIEELSASQDHLGKSEKAKLNVLLRRAESAYSFGRLEQAKRYFLLALKLAPESEATKRGLEKVAAEMQ